MKNKTPDYEYCTYNRYSGEINRIPISFNEALYYDIPLSKRSIPYLIIPVKEPVTLNTFKNSYSDDKLGLESGNTTCDKNELLEAIKSLYYKARNKHSYDNYQDLYREVFYGLKNHIFGKYGITL